MDVLHAHCCGIDVHAKFLVACCRHLGPSGRVTTTSRTFETMTADLRALAAWLQEAGVTQVAIESTGVLWQPVWNILEPQVTIVLVNPRDVRQVPGRKTDVSDAEWLAQLLQYGLLRGSVVPPAAIRELRDLTRGRVKLVDQTTAVANRLHAVLHDANQAGLGGQRHSRRLGPGRCSRRSSRASATRSGWRRWRVAACGANCRRCSARSPATSPTTIGSCCGACWGNWPFSRARSASMTRASPRRSALLWRSWPGWTRSRALPAARQRTSWPSSAPTWPSFPAPPTWRRGWRSVPATMKRGGNSTTGRRATATAGRAAPAPKPPGGPSMRAGPMPPRNFADWPRGGGQTRDRRRGPQSPGRGLLHHPRRGHVSRLGPGPFRSLGAHATHAVLGQASGTPRTQSRSGDRGLVDGIFVAATELTKATDPLSEATLQ